MPCWRTTWLRTWNYLAHWFIVKGVTSPGELGHVPRPYMVPESNLEQSGKTVLKAFPQVTGGTPS